MLENRQDKRFDFKCEISGRSDHQFFTGFTENISKGGLFLATYQTEPIGTTFDISFNVAGIDHEFACTVEVAWVREYNEMAPEMKTGMGVRFKGLSPKDEQLLNAILQRVETLFYDSDDDL